MNLDALIAAWTRRLAALFDPSAWLLIAPALGALLWIDPAMGLTLVQWSLFALVLAGVAVVISRIVFPQMNLSELVAEAMKGNRAAAAAAAALVVFVALLFIGIVLWARHG